MGAVNPIDARNVIKLRDKAENALNELGKAVFHDERRTMLEIEMTAREVLGTTKRINSFKINLIERY